MVPGYSQQSKDFKKHYVQACKNSRNIFTHMDFETITKILDLHWPISIFEHGKILIQCVITRASYEHTEQNRIWFQQAIKCNGRSFIPPYTKSLFQYLQATQEIIRNFVIMISSKSMLIAHSGSLKMRQNACRWIRIVPSDRLILYAILTSTFCLKMMEWYRNFEYPHSFVLLPHSLQHNLYRRCHKPHVNSKDK